MRQTARVWRFSLVGVIGIGVQLGVLWALVAMKFNYLAATACAVESAVLHNFLWHQAFTWTDRAGAWRVRLMRFHLSNGLISLMGNLLLMRLLVGCCHLPVILANLLTISVCFAANFLVSDRWVFADSGFDNRTRLLAFIPHQQQRALGKGNVDECGGHA